MLSAWNSFICRGLNGWMGRAGPLRPGLQWGSLPFGAQQTWASCRPHLPSLYGLG